MTVVKILDIVFRSADKKERYASDEKKKEESVNLYESSRSRRLNPKRERESPEKGTLGILVASRECKTLHVVRTIRTKGMGNARGNYRSREKRFPPSFQLFNRDDSNPFVSLLSKLTIFNILRDD